MNAEMKQDAYFSSSYKLFLKGKFTS